MPRNLRSWIVVAVLFGAPPLFAEWLVTVEGGRVETQGPWRVEGEKVYFTLKNGTLSVLRKREVDLDASAVATAEAKKKTEPAEAPPAPSKTKAKPMLVLTDEDIPRAVELTEAAALATSDGAEAKEAASKVVVDSWKVVEKGSGIEVIGILRNSSEALEAQIEVEVKLKDMAGTDHTAKAFLRQGSLSGGRSTSFRAKMGEIFTVNGEPSFVVTSQSISVGVTKKENDASGGTDAAPAKTGASEPGGGSDQGNDSRLNGL